MKRLYIYRILVLLLIFGLGFTLMEYKNKECITIKEEKIVNPNYVFLGDSITDFYNLDKYYDDKIPLVNSGIDGNKVEDILDNIDKRVFNYNPSKVILLIGVNNLLTGSSVEETTKKIKELTDKISKKLPNCQIYVESVYPTNNDEWKKRNRSVISEEEMKPKIKELNTNLKDLCLTRNYTYIDLYKVLRTEDDIINSEYTDDGLHPNDNGYKVITKELKKVLKIEKKD